MRSDYATFHSHLLQGLFLLYCRYIFINFVVSNSFLWPWRSFWQSIESPVVPIWRLLAIPPPRPHRPVPMASSAKGPSRKRVGWFWQWMMPWSWWGVKTNAVWFVVRMVIWMDGLKTWGNSVQVKWLKCVCRGSMEGKKWRWLDDVACLGVLLVRCFH